MAPTCCGFGQKLQWSECRFDAKIGEHYYWRQGGDRVCSHNAISSICQAGQVCHALVTPPSYRRDRACSLPPIVFRVKSQLIPAFAELCSTLNTAVAPDHNLGTSANTGQGGHWGQPWGTVSAGQTIRLLSFQIHVDILFIHPLVTSAITVAPATGIPGLARCAG